MLFRLHLYELLPGITIMCSGLKWNYHIPIYEDWLLTKVDDKDRRKRLYEREVSETPHSLPNRLRERHKLLRWRHSVAFAAIISIDNRKFERENEIGNLYLKWLKVVCSRMYD